MILHNSKLRERGISNGCLNRFYFSLLYRNLFFFNKYPLFSDLAANNLTNPTIFYYFRFFPPFCNSKHHHPLPVTKYLILHYYLVVFFFLISLELSVFHQKRAFINIPILLTPPDWSSSHISSSSLCPQPLIKHSDAEPYFDEVLCL